MLMACNGRDRCGKTDCHAGKPHVFKKSVCLPKEYKSSCRGLSVWCEEAPQKSKEAQTQQATCDKCGKKIETSWHDAFEFHFKRITGNSYPEGGSGEEEMLDLCQDCSKEVVDLLKENGYNVQVNGWDW